MISSGKPFEVLQEGAAGIDEAWARRWALGRALIAAYLVVGVLAVSVGAATASGPFAWLASGEAALLGVAFPLLSAVIGYALLAIPLVWLLRRPSGASTPMLLGAQQGFEPNRRLRFAASTRRRLAEARAFRAWSLAAAAASLTVGAAGAFVSQRPGPDAGRRLPVLTRTEAVAAPDPLPRYARLTQVVDQPRAAWTYDHHVRQTFYRDAYLPLTAPGWRPGDPVDVLELDRLLPDASPTASNRFDPPGPREGALSRGALEAWRAEAMRRAGLHLTSRPIVLDRQPLGGVAPGPDWVDAFLWLDCSLALAFTLGVLAWRASRTADRLQREEPEEAVDARRRREPGA